MPVCKKCGCFTSDPNVCLNCGAPREKSAPVNKRPEEPRVKWAEEPAAKRTEEPRAKRAETPRAGLTEEPRVKKAVRPAALDEAAINDKEMFEPVGEPSRYSDDEPPKKSRKGLVITLVIILCLEIGRAHV